MGDVGVGESDPQHPRPLPRALGEGVLEVLEYSGAEAAGQDILLDRHQQLVVVGEPLDQLAVDRLREATVGNRHMKIVFLEDGRRFLGDGDAVAVAEQRHPLAFGKHLSLADRHQLRP